MIVWVYLYLISTLAFGQQLLLERRNKLQLRRPIRDSLEKSLEKNNLKNSQKATFLNLLSQEYFRLDDIKAIQFAQQAIPLAKKSKDLQQEAIGLGQIGRILLCHGLMNEGRQYLLQALELLKEKDTLETINFYIKIGESYYDEKLYKQSLYYDSLALALWNVASSNVQINFLKGGLYANIADDYLLLGLPHYSFPYIKKINHLIEEKIILPETLEYAWSLYLLAEYARQNANYKSSIDLATKSLKFSLEQNDWEQVYYNTQVLLKSYEKLQYYEKAFTYGKLSMQAQDSIQKNKRPNEFALLNIKQQVALKNQQISNIETISSYQIVLFIIVLFSGTLVLILLFLRQKQLNALNQLLNTQKQQLDMNRQELQEANQEFQLLNGQLEKIVYERTKALELRNRQLLEYNLINSQKLKGPASRIKGLVEVLAIFHEKDLPLREKKTTISMIAISALELDEMTRKIARLLEQEEGFKPGEA